MRASILSLRLSRPAAVLMLLLFLAMVTYAQITPSDDAYTNTAAPTINYGAKPLLDVVSPSQTTYVTFDLSSIPAGYTSANLAKASLKLYVNAVTTAGSFNVDFVNGTWSEKTITASLAPALGTTVVASVPLAKANVHDYILVDVTSAVGAWLNGTQANDGLALVANSPLNASFDSKESGTQSQPPELDIVFTGGGGGGTITGVLTGAGSGLTGGGTSGTLNLSLVTNCAANQVLQWSGSAWACSNAGTGTITGVTAGTDLTGGGTSGNVTLSLDITKVPQLNYANVFTGNQTVNGNLSATGVVTGSSFGIGSNLFAFGSYANRNAFLGFAGNTTTTGTNNSATGFQALLSNTTGYQNTADGYVALSHNTTGHDNTATGNLTLYSNTAGYDNTASGSNALNRNTTGNDNTASGAYALVSNSTGNYNTASGSNALNNNTTGNDNTASGYLALLLNTTGYQNTATGSNALASNTTGNDNTASGFLALLLNTTGSENTASGSNALASNTTGNYNTASGSSALPSNTTGYRNTASGGLALFFNTTGFDNTANGFDALNRNTTGNHNTASGALALLSNSTGEDNTALGASADVGSVNLNNATAIGAHAKVSQSNALVLGGTGNFAVNVGIGTETPQYTLDVQGSGRFTGNLTKGGGSFKIDHPLDPANKYLSHSFVESPDMMNIYNGNVVTDRRGLASIELPDWFEALNRDFRYQLTVIGQFAQAIVVKEVSNHQFTIKTSKPGVKVSWQVTGIRQDVYANAHRIPVEETKPPQEQGRYLHPELFGAGPEKSVNARAPAVTAAQTAAWAPAGATTQQH